MREASLAHLGIIGVAKCASLPRRCIGCGACVKACSHHAVLGCLALKNGKAVKKESACIGCAARCVLACPTLARQRKPDQLTAVRLGGRRWNAARRQALLNWVTEDVIKRVIVSLYEDLKRDARRKTDISTYGPSIDKRAALPAFLKGGYCAAFENPEAWSPEHLLGRSESARADASQTRRALINTPWPQRPQAAARFFPLTSTAASSSGPSGQRQRWPLTAITPALLFSTEFHLNHFTEPTAFIIARNRAASPPPVRS